jgi:glycosyltransferase involved in cell wall biosynthesis
LKRLGLVTPVELTSQTGQSLRINHLLGHLSDTFKISLMAAGVESSGLPSGVMGNSLLAADEDMKLWVKHPWRLLSRGIPMIRHLRRFSQQQDCLYTDSPVTWLGIAGRGRSVVIEVNGIHSEELVKKGVFAGDGVLFRLYQKLEQVCYRQVQAIIAVSPGIKDYLIGQFGISAEKITVISNGIDLTFFKSESDRNSLRRKLKLPACEIAVFVGSFRPWHGVKNLIRALPVAIRRYPNLTLVLIGDGPCRDAIQRLVVEMNLKQHVLFLGSQPHHQIPQFIHAADICLYYPSYEVAGYGFMGDPIKLYEYMAMGRPVIVPAVPNFADVVTREKAGVVVEGNQEAFGEAMADLLSQPVLCREMGNNGQAAMRARYGWEHITQRIAARIEAVS